MTDMKILDNQVKDFCIAMVCRKAVNLNISVAYKHVNDR